MTTKKFFKVFAFLMIFSVGFLALQSCKDKKNDKQTTEVKAEASDMKCEAGKCGDGKCGDGKVAKDSTATEEGKCGDGSADGKPLATDGKCGDDKTSKDSTATKEGKCG